jgi:carbamoyltransferase
MLVVAPVRAEQRRVIPAVTHVDGSGRLQTVSAAITPRFHRLIERFGEATGVPVLLNTSFNLRGEPIVNTPREAFNSFNRSDMDLLVLGDRLIDKAT